MALSYLLLALENEMYQYEKLDVWKYSVILVRDIYSITEKFPIEEKYSLSNQIQRAAVSISLNIAEGRGSDSQKEFIKYLYISLKSLYEVSAAFRIAVELGYLKENDSDYEGLLVDMEKLGASLRALINRIKKDSNGKSK